MNRSHVFDLLRLSCALSSLALPACKDQAVGSQDAAQGGGAPNGAAGAGSPDAAASGDNAAGIGSSSGGATANGAGGGGAEGAVAGGQGGGTDSGAEGAVAGGQGAGTDSGAAGAEGAVAGGQGGGTDSGAAGAAEDIQVTGVHVRMDTTFQTIQGFGIMTAWMPTGTTIPVDRLFGLAEPDAIGLSILRVGMADTGALHGGFIEEARAYGAKIIGAVFSPPADCKSNGNTRDGGHLLESCYESWSDTIANFAEQYQLYAMSLATEPDFASCPELPVCDFSFDTTEYTAREMVQWVKVAAPKLKAVGVKVIAPEPAEWLHLWSNASATGSLIESYPHSSDPLDCGCFANHPTDEGCAQHCLDGDGYDYGHWLWADQEAWNALDILGVHQYDAQLGFPFPEDVNGGVRDKEVWQTEMAGVMHWPEQGPSTDINNGVTVAGWIHSALTVGEASAWVWRFYEGYFQNDNEGLALTQGTTTIARRYYTLGNYSKFVRPGYVAVKVAGNERSSVQLSAYKSQDDNIVIVAINKSDDAEQFPITLVGGASTTSLTPHVTSATQNLEAGPAIPVADGVFTASLPPMTVTTFVGQ